MIDETDKEFLDIYPFISKALWMQALPTLENLSQKHYFCASVFLSLLYSISGMIGPQDSSKSQYYLHLSEKQLNQSQIESAASHHQTSLGVYFYLKKDYTKSLKYFERSAQQGDPTALLNFGR